MNGAVYLNFILQLFWFLKAIFCWNFYKIFKKRLTKKCEEPAMGNFTNNFQGVGKSALRLLCFNASGNCQKMRK